MAAIAIPTGNDERVTWSLNFEVEFPILGPGLGFSAAEITALVNASAAMRYAIMNAQTAAAYSKTCMAFKNDMLGGVDDNTDTPKIPVYTPLGQPTEVEAGILERLSKAIQRAKLSPNFNQSVAQQLMVATPTPDPPNPDDAKPTGSGTALTGSIVRIDWKKGKFDGVFIDSERGDETTWTRLDFDMRSPYEDTRPPLATGKPEERRYRLIYFIDNQTVGVWSDMITVITLP